MKHYIGFDLGAESGRCHVGRLVEDTLSLTEVHRFVTPNYTSGDSIHWDISSIFQEMCIGLTEAGKTFGTRFDGIGIDTWGVDYALIDRDDRILGDPCHYRDGRTDGMMDASFRIVPKDRLYRKTGIQFAQFNTLYQLIAEKNALNNLLEHAATMLLIPDYLNFLLSGVKKAEYTIASTSSLANPNTRDWAWELMQSFGFYRKLFPEIIEPGTNLGCLLPDLAEKTGLDASTPIIATAGHDTAAAVASVPTTSGNWAYLSSGTWSLMGVERARPITDRRAMEYNFTNEGGVDGSTRFLKNIIGLWPVQECRRYWSAEGKKYTYAELAELAEANGPATAWVQLDDMRFLKSGNMPDKIIDFLKETKQSYELNVGFIIRCVLESLAFKYRTTLSEVKQITGEQIDVLHAVGGGIENKLLNQLTADALDVTVIAGPTEGAVVGNIGTQAIATGAVKDLKALRRIVRRSFDLETYTPKNTGYFNAHVDLYRRVTSKE